MQTSVLASKLHIASPKPLFSAFLVFFFFLGVMHIASPKDPALAFQGKLMNCESQVLAFAGISVHGAS